MNIRRNIVFVIVLAASVSFFFSCSLNQYAVKKSISPGAGIGIIAYDFMEGYAEDVSLAFIRNFVAKGYNVKALNTIPLGYTFPLLEKTFKGSLNINSQSQINDLIQFPSLLANQMEVKKELAQLRSEMQLDYLLVVHGGQWRNSERFSLVGINMEDFTVVYVQTYQPSAGCFLAYMNPFYKEEHLEHTIAELIRTMSTLRGSASVIKSDAP